MDDVFNKSVFYYFPTFGVYIHSYRILHSLSNSCFLLTKLVFSVSRSVIIYITLTVTNISNNNKTILQYNKNVQKF